MNLRETSQFHAACDWFGPAWTVVHVVATGSRVLTWDLSKDLQGYP